MGDGAFAGSSFSSTIFFATKAQRPNFAATQSMLVAAKHHVHVTSLDNVEGVGPIRMNKRWVALRGVGVERDVGDLVRGARQNGRRDRRTWTYSLRIAGSDLLEIPVAAQATCELCGTCSTFREVSLDAIDPFDSQGLAHGQPVSLHQ